MPLTLKERQAVVKELAVHYRRAGKGDKGRILDEACQLLGYNRTYAARVLRQPPQRSARTGGRRPGSGRKPIYDDEVITALRRVWAVMGFAAGKRMAPFMAEIVTALERHGELRLSPKVREQLLRMSAATIDRRLAADRKKMQLRGRSGTKPGSLLKGQIPIRTFAEWDDARPGFIEIDLVGHEGGNPRGEFAQTLDMVDIATQWTETVAVKNKAQKWVFEALTAHLPQFPFPILGIDSDNGSEFINDHLLRYCRQHRITFTRSRPGKKNDNAHVEQKNWTVVRQTVGYLRYDTPEQLAVLNQLYDRLRLYTNFFQPVQKLVSKTRHGAKVHRTYDRAQTPYQRVMASPDISDKRKEELRAQYETLNPAALRREITSLQQRLMELALPTANSTEEVPHLEYISF